MAIHTTNLVIPTKEILKYDDLMSKGCVDLNKLGFPSCGNVKTWSVAFDDGKVFDLRVNTSDDSLWCEGVLLGQLGNSYYEIAVDDVRDYIYGSSFDFKVGDDTYVVYIVADHKSATDTIQEPNYKDIVDRIKNILKPYCNWYERGDTDDDQFKAEYVLDRVIEILKENK